jgi:hypothetical protein
MGTCRSRLLFVALALSATAAASWIVPRAAAGQTARPDTLVDAGVERYRAGAYREAVAILNSVVASQPGNPRAHLYLSLSHLRLGEDSLAERHLVALRSLSIGPRLRVKVDHVVEGLRTGPLTPPLRQFIAGTLEETMQAERPERPVLPTALGAGGLNRNFPYFP